MKHTPQSVIEKREKKGKPLNSIASRINSTLNTDEHSLIYTQSLKQEIQLQTQSTLFA